MSTTRESVSPVALLRPKDAAVYLAISLRALQSRADIPRVDLSAPGSKHAMWRYSTRDLDRFIEMKTVQPFNRDAA